MRRALLSGLTCGLVLAAAVSARSGDDEPPPLTPPAEAPPVLEPPKNTKAATKPVGTVKKPTATATSRPSSTLMRPLSADSPIRVAPVLTSRPLVNQPASPVLDELPPPLDQAGGVSDLPPPLDGPSATSRFPDRSPGPFGGVSRRRVETPDPVLLAPIDSPDDMPPPLTAEDPADIKDVPAPSNKPKHDAPPARKRFGLLAAPNARARNNNNTGRDAAIRVEPRSDPAADAALKRKLEAKVKEAVGNRAKDIEVRVVDRNIVIRAEVDRFWNRRNVRRTIESLPALSGYKARVEIDD